jgi:hypothetical protein
MKGKGFQWYKEGWQQIVNGRVRGKERWAGVVTK